MISSPRRRNVFSSSRTSCHSSKVCPNLALGSTEAAHNYSTSRGSASIKTMEEPASSPSTRRSMGTKATKRKSRVKASPGLSP